MRDSAKCGTGHCSKAGNDTPTPREQLGELERFSPGYALALGGPYMRPQPNGGYVRLSDIAKLLDEPAAQPRKALEQIREVFEDETANASFTLRTWVRAVADGALSHPDEGAELQRLQELAPHEISCRCGCKTGDTFTWLNHAEHCPRYEVGAMVDAARSDLTGDDQTGSGKENSQVPKSEPGEGEKGGQVERLEVAEKLRDHLTHEMDMRAELDEPTSERVASAIEIALDDPRAADLLSHVEGEAGPWSVVEQTEIHHTSPGIEEAASRVARHALDVGANGDEMAALVRRACIDLDVQESRDVEGVADRG